MFIIFRLDLYKNSGLTDVLGADIHIGSVIYSEVTWDVKTLQQDVYFYVNECNLHLSNGEEDEEATIVQIIKENCYSEGAHVTMLNTGDDKWLQSEKSSFSFTVFTTRPRAATISVDVKCKLNFCLLSDNRCTIKKTAQDCPLVPGYNYTPVGYVP